jgi:flagellar biosynthesis protein FlhF
VTAAVEARDPLPSAVAAGDPPAAAPGAPAAAADVIAQALAFHGLTGPLACCLAEEADAYAAEGPLMALSAALDGLIAFQPLCERRQQRPVLLVGGPGAGKTLTAAKLVYLAVRAGRPVTAITTDLDRAGGVEQLDAFLRLLGLPLATAADPDALAAAVRAAAGGLAVIDTAGANLFDAAAFARLRDLIEAAAAEPVYVAAAGGDIPEAIDAAAEAVALGCRRMIVTRIDGVRRRGALVAVAEATGLALADIGIGPSVADGLMPLNPVSLARLLLPAEGDAPPRPIEEAPR